MNLSPKFEEIADIEKRDEKANQGNSRLDKICSNAQEVSKGIFSILSLCVI